MSGVVSGGEPRRTPLYDRHVEAGARMVDFAGWAMPVQYRSILVEHRAVRQDAGLFDVSHMGEFEIAGAGAEALCARLFTNDARMLVPGKAQYSMIANEQGGVVDDIIVYRLEAERFWVCVNASNTAKDLAWIRAHPMEGAEVRDLSDQTALLAVQGPRAAAILERILPGISDLGRFACRPCDHDGTSILVARTGYSGEDGFELFVPDALACPLWDLLLETGGGDGLIACGLGARDTLRVEAALPLYGHELGDDISPYEVGLGWAVKRNRPDMLGLEAFERAAAGGVSRRLVGLLLDGGIAREGAPVFLPGGAEAVGHVSSGTHSPTLGRPVAMALIAREAAEAASSKGQGADGGSLEVELRGKRRAASVTSLPFCVKRRAS